MRILVVPSTLDGLNLGDVALLQMCIRRLRSLWPQSEIHVLTTVPERLPDYCPGAIPLLYAGWFTEHYLLGRFHKCIPAWASRWIKRSKVALRRRCGAPEILATRTKLFRRRKQRNAFNHLVEVLERLDLMVLAGAGGIADVFPVFSGMCLTALEFAFQRGTPAALFGHGFGPLRDTELLRRAARVLPHAGFVALRERRLGFQLMRQLGVPGDRVLFTGDDAVEMAYEIRASSVGTRIGVNLRFGTLTGIDLGLVQPLRQTLRAFVAERKAAITILPIGLRQDMDRRASEEFLVGFPDVQCCNPDSPQDLIKEAGRCRIVITAAYHAAVFALAQGVPVVCLARSEYFRDKLLGLQEQFRDGCEVLNLDDGNLTSELSAAVNRLWSSAEPLRPVLLESARQQVVLGNAAANRLKYLCETDRSRLEPSASVLTKRAAVHAVTRNQSE